MVGGIVLAGGRSSRMGRPKASLEWHGSTLVRRIAGLVERGVGGPVVIVSSAGQELPRLPERYEVVEDPHEGRGPLEGLLAGLRALAGRAELAYVSSTDVPFLHSSFVGAVVGGIGAGAEICVPVIGRGWQPLAAAYRTNLVAVVEDLLAADERRVSALLECCGVTRLDRAALRANPGVAEHDPQLESIVNVNDPETYALARARPAPEVAVTWPDRSALVRAATLGRLVGRSGLGDGLRVSVNGVATAADRGFPLEAGDSVTFTAGTQP